MEAMKLKALAGIATADAGDAPSHSKTINFPPDAEMGPNSCQSGSPNQGNETPQAENGDDRS